MGLGTAEKWLNEEEGYAPQRYQYDENVIGNAKRLLACENPPIKEEYTEFDCRISYFFEYQGRIIYLSGILVRVLHWL